MDIKLNKISNNLYVVKIKGKFNIENIILFEENIYKLITSKISSIFLNFSQLEHIDSSGIGALIKAMNVAKRSNIDLILYDLPEPIYAIFKTAHLNNFFNIKRSNELRNFFSKDDVT